MNIDIGKILLAWLVMFVVTIGGLLASGAIKVRIIQIEEDEDLNEDEDNSDKKDGKRD